MAVLSIENLLVKFGAGKSPKSGDYLDLIDTLADDRNAVYFSATAPEDTGANPIWFNTSTNVLSVYSNEAWSNIDLSLKAPLASPTFTGTVTIPSGSSISDIPYLATANTFTASQIIQPTSTTSVGLIVKGLASQTANLQEWQDSTGAIVAAMWSSGTFSTAGRVSIGNGSSGAKLDVLIASSTQLGLVVKGVISQTANLQEWQNSAGTASAYVTSGGSLKANSIRANTVSYLGVIGAVSTVATDIGIVVRGAASQTGDLQQWQNSAGTVLTGITSAGQLYTTQRMTVGLSAISSLGNLVVSTADAARVGVVVAGVASQTANLQQWQDSAGTVLGAMSAGPSMPSGSGLFFSAGYTRSTYFYVGATIVNSADNASYITFNPAGTNSSSIQVTSRAASHLPLSVRGAASQTADLQQWQDSAGTVLGRVASNGVIKANVGLVAENNTSGNYTALQVNSYVASGVGIIIVGEASQTADLQQWMNSAGTVLAKVNSSGNIVAGNMAIATSSVSTIHISNGTIPSADPTGGGVLYVEAGALKFRGSSGTVTTIAVA